MNDCRTDDSSLCAEVYQLLRTATDGLSEYQLIQQLRARQSTHLAGLSLGDNLGLFRTHFLLFNALYQLRDQLWRTQAGTLHISPLSIQLLPYEPGSTALAEHDPLREYYLDLCQLASTDADAVEQLLSRFWARLQGAENLQAALELFELADANTTLNLKTIKLRYRQLVSLHHPDRSGSTARLQAINLAMEILKQHYSST